MTSNNLSVNLVIAFFVAIYRLLNLSRGITVGHGGSTHVFQPPASTFKVLICTRP